MSLEILDIKILKGYDYKMIYSYLLGISSLIFLNIIFNKIIRYFKY